MTTTYTAEVIALDGPTMRLRLTKTDESELFPDSTAAGLYLLIESAARVRPNAQLTELMDQDWWDTEWLFEHAAGHVASFDPVAEGGTIGEVGAWMEYALVAVDAGRLAHLRRGARWDSACPEI